MVEPAVTKEMVEAVKKEALERLSSPPSERWRIMHPKEYEDYIRESQIGDTMESQEN